MTGVPPDSKATVVSRRRYDAVFEAAKGALELLRAMEEANALRIPYPRHRRVVEALRRAVED